MTALTYYDDFTKEERSALRKMDAAMKTLSNRHWFFAASGTMCIMRKGDDDNRVVNTNGGMNNDYVAAIMGSGCDIDGGDW